MLKVLSETTGVGGIDDFSFRMVCEASFQYAIEPTFPTVQLLLLYNLCHQ